MLRAATTEATGAVRAWITSRYGSGRKFRSAREWSVAAGLSPGVASNIENTGRYQITTLIELARASGDSPLWVLHSVGHLTAEEVDPASVQLTGDERGLMENFRLLSERQQRVIRELCLQLAGSGRDHNSTESLTDRIVGRETVQTDRRLEEAGQLIGMKGIAGR